MMKILTESEIRDLTKEEKKKYFVDLQNFVVVNLSAEQRSEYGDQQRQIPLDEYYRKIKFLTTYVEIATLNSKLKKKISWLKSKFPEEANKILDRLERKIDDDKLMYLNNQIAKLKKDLPQKLMNQKDKLLRDLRNLIGRDETASFFKTISEVELKEQVSELKRKYNRLIAKKTNSPKQISSKI